MIPFGSLDSLLNETNLLVTAGSGGVGKTTIAAALALRAARNGQRVAVVTIDPAKRLAQALGLDNLSGVLKAVKLDEVTMGGGTLSAMMLDVQTTADLMVKRFAETPAAAQKILENSYYQQFSAAVAGSQEYVALEQVRILLDEHNFDLVVLDTPPAVHALDFLDAPERLRNGLRNIPLRSSGDDSDEVGIAGRLAARGRGLVMKGLNHLTGGPFIEDLAEFLRAFSSILAALENAASRVEILLREPTTRFFLVATPTQSQMNEAVRFRAALKKRTLPFSGFVVNRVHDYNETSALGRGALSQAIREMAPNDVDDKTLEEVVDGLERSSHLNQQLAKRDDSMISTLEQTGRDAILQVPRLMEDIHSIEGLIQIGLKIHGRRAKTN